MAAYCKENLPRYKQPKKIIFATVPRNPTGKLEKADCASLCVIFFSS